MKNAGTERIETNRLILRRFHMEDADKMFRNWANDPEVCQFLTWAPHESIEVTKELLRNWIDSYERDDTYNWAIVHKDRNEPIGSIGFIEVSKEHASCQTGYCIGKSYWGIGLMTEALRAVISFAFQNTGLNRIEARHDVRNPASGKVMEKAGMHLEGTLRQCYAKKDGTFADLNIWSILHGEWNK